MADSKDAPQIIEHISQSINFMPFAAKWVPVSARLAVVGATNLRKGALHIYQMDKGKLNPLANSEKPSEIKCATFGASAFEQRHLATGDYDGKLNIWDLERLDKAILSVQAHPQMVSSIDGCGGLSIAGAPEIVTGGRDGSVKVWDVRQEDPVLVLEPSEDSNVKRDVWAVAFGNSYNDQERCVAMGYDGGELKLVDLRYTKILWETNVKNGIVSLQFDRKDISMNKLLVTGVEAWFRVYNTRTLHPDEGYAYVAANAHNSTVWCGSHLPQNREVFATTGGNGSVNIYKYSYPAQQSVKDPQGREKGVPGTVKLLSSKKLSEQPIVHCDWSADKQGLCALTCLNSNIKVVLVTKTQSL